MRRKDVWGDDSIHSPLGPLVLEIGEGDRIRGREGKVMGSFLGPYS